MEAEVSRDDGVADVGDRLVAQDREGLCRTQGLRLGVAAQSDAHQAKRGRDSERVTQTDAYCSPHLRSPKRAESHNVKGTLKRTRRLLVQILLIQLRSGWPPSFRLVRSLIRWVEPTRAYGFVPHDKTGRPRLPKGR